jgi:hypothetical protein
LIINFASAARFLLLAISAIVLTTTSASAGSDVSSSKQQIQTLISSIYDKPGLKVETSPIAISGDYAVADWVQGDRGGRALLHRINGKWSIAACGANDLKKPKTLTDAGIPAKTAKDLVDQLASSEQSVSPERIKLFSLFGSRDDPASTEHHHDHAK